MNSYFLSRIFLAYTNCNRFIVHGIMLAKHNIFQVAFGIVQDKEFKMTGQMMYPPDDDQRQEDSWQQEMDSQGFSRNAIDAFARLMSPEITTSQDVLILYFSRSVPLSEIGTLEETLRELLSELYSQELQELAGGVVIRIRTIEYYNPVFIAFGVALAVGSAAFIVLDTLDDDQKRSIDRKAQRIFNFIRRKPETRTSYPETRASYSISEDTESDSDDNIEEVANILVKTATQFKEHEEREDPPELAIASRGFVGVVQFFREETGT